MVGAQPIPDFPEYRKAAAREHLIRVAAGLNLTEKICGLEVMPLTPYHLRFLSLVNSPFLIEGLKVEDLIDKGNPKKEGLTQDAIAFLWIVSPLYVPNGEKRRWFKKTNREKFSELASGILIEKADKVFSEILQYIEDAFIDHEPGGKSESKSYFCEEMTFAYELHHCHGFRLDYWNDEPRKNNPSHVPLKIIFQLRKAHKAASDAEAVLTNRSEKIISDGLANMNQRN